jgi:hypothetical protein
MATDSDTTRNVSNPNNAPRYTGDKSVARNDKVGYNRSNVGGTQKRTDGRSSKRY